MELSERIGFGCVGLTVQPNISEALKILETAYNDGITFFDTAPVYGKGYSEVILGKFLAKKRREEFTITTKFGLGEIPIPKLPSSFALPLNFLKKNLKQQKGHVSTKSDYKIIPNRSITLQQVKFDFYNSLKRLNTEYIDNYLLHEATPSFLTDEASVFLFDLKAKGLIKSLGMGVCHKNLLEIQLQEIQHWDILQYENNKEIESDGIFHQHREKKHIHHSLFKNFNRNLFPEIATKEQGGYLLAAHLMKFTKAKVIFSSQNRDNIINNLKYARLFYDKV